MKQVQACPLQRSRSGTRHSRLRDWSLQSLLWHGAAEMLRSCQCNRAALVPAGMPLQQLSTAMAAPKRYMTLNQLGGVECLLIVTSLEVMVRSALHSSSISTWRRYWWPDMWQEGYDLRDPVRSVISSTNCTIISGDRCQCVRYPGNIRVGMGGPTASQPSQQGPGLVQHARMMRQCALVLIHACPGVHACCDTVAKACGMLARTGAHRESQRDKISPNDSRSQRETVKRKPQLPEHQAARHQQVGSHVSKLGWCGRSDWVHSSSFRSAAARHSR
jgi:hypothetical protein